VEMSLKLAKYIFTNTSTPFYIQFMNQLQRSEMVTNIGEVEKLLANIGPCGNTIIGATLERLFVNQSNHQNMFFVTASHPDEDYLQIERMTISAFQTTPGQSIPYINIADSVEDHVYVRLHIVQVGHNPEATVFWRELNKSISEALKGFDYKQVRELKFTHPIFNSSRVMF
jgi:hypothetical protein